MMRVLVTGASGLLGRAVHKELLKANFQVLGLSFSRERPGLRRCDLRCEEQLGGVLQDFQPNFIIHCAAERRPDVVEKQPEATKAINVEATALLCRLAAQSQAHVIYISTDYVFDGRSPPYSIDSKPNPLNAYGLSKLAGEQEALKITGNVVLRVPILYGEVERLDESAVTVLFAKVKDTSHPAPMNSSDKRYPTHVQDVARVLIGYLRLPDATRPVGILHWTGDEMMTKLDMAMAMGQELGLPTAHIQADAGTAAGAPRPPDAHLDRSILERLGCASDRPFRPAVAACLRPFLDKS